MEDNNFEDGVRAMYNGKYFSQELQRLGAEEFERQHRISVAAARYWIVERERLKDDPRFARFAA